MATAMYSIHTSVGFPARKPTWRPTRSLRKPTQRLWQAFQNWAYVEAYAKAYVKPTRAYAVALRSLSRIDFARKPMWAYAKPYAKPTRAYMVAVRSFSELSLRWSRRGAYASLHGQRPPPPYFSLWLPQTIKTIKSRHSHLFSLFLAPWGRLTRRLQIRIS